MPENPRIEELRRRVDADPASIAFAALAEEYRRQGRYDEAIETCAAGLQRHPAYLSARVTLGRALIETGDLDAARQQFETVLQSAPENIAATRGLAQIHERLGHSTEMDPHLAQLMREHVEAAATASHVARAPEAEPEPEPEALAPLKLAEADLQFLQEPPEPSEPAPFDLHLAPPGAVAFVEPPIPDMPDPAVVAAISNLERFLAAIQHARRA